MGTPVYVTLLVAAIAGVVALSVGWFARITARDIAALTANQKRQDVRIKALGAYVDLLMSAAAATQAYVWYADPEFVRTKEITQEDWDSARELFQPAYEASSKVKYLGTALADESVKGAWHRIVRAEGQPDSIAAAITAANDLYKKALADYPTEVPNSITRHGTKKGTPALHSRQR